MSFNPKRMLYVQKGVLIKAATDYSRSFFTDNSGMETLESLILAAIAAGLIIVVAAVKDAGSAVIEEAAGKV